jgi:ferredoxin-NADP reductase
LFEEVGVGSELKFRGPQGVFTLPEGLDRDLYLICTGTGIAPFRAMAHHILNHHIAHQHIYLIFGTRTFKDALYRAELQQLQQDIGSFTFIPVFSREEPGEGYETGYVHEAYEKIIEQKKLFNPTTGQIENSPAFFFLCGWKNMIDEARHRIEQAGYDRKSVHLELYG